MHFCMFSNLENVDEILSNLRHKTPDLYGYVCITRLDQSSSVFIFSTKATAVVSEIQPHVRDLQMHL